MIAWQRALRGMGRTGRNQRVSQVIRTKHVVVRVRPEEMIATGGPLSACFPGTLERLLVEISNM